MIRVVKSDRAGSRAPLRTFSARGWELFPSSQSLLVMSVEKRMKTCYLESVISPHCSNTLINITLKHEL